MITVLSLIHSSLPHFFYRSTTLNESDIIMPSLIGFLNEWEKSFWILLSALDENVNKTHWEHVVQPEVKAKQTWRQNIKTSSTMPTSASDFFRSQIIDINKMEMVEERKERNGRGKKKMELDMTVFSSLQLTGLAITCPKKRAFHFAWPKFISLGVKNEIK